MKNILIASLMLLTLGIFAISAPVTISAQTPCGTNSTPPCPTPTPRPCTTGSGAPCPPCTTNNQQNCTPPLNVPEFGMLPGIVAAVASAGSYIALKRRK